MRVEWLQTVMEGAGAGRDGGGKDSDLLCGHKFGIELG